MTTPSDTQSPIQEAVAAARAEIVARGEPDPFTGEMVEAPASGSEDGIEVLVEEDQADPVEDEQAPELLVTPDDGADENTDEVFADLELEETEEPQAPPAAPDSYEVPGMDEPVPVQELINGYLRHDDYTRKTQAVAKDREQNAKAIQLYDALTTHPHELAKQLAVAAGLIEADAQPLRVVDLPFRPEADIQSEIEQKVAEALESHPDIVAARDVLLLQWVDSEFARLEEKIGKPIGPKSREKVLKVAGEKGIDDLEMVFNSLMTQMEAKARDSEKMKRAAPVKPTGTPQTQTVTTPPETPVDAAMQAAAELGITLDPSKLNFR